MRTKGKGEKFVAQGKQRKELEEFIFCACCRFRAFGYANKQSGFFLSPALLQLRC